MVTGQDIWHTFLTALCKWLVVFKASTYILGPRPAGSVLALVALRSKLRAFSVLKFPSIGVRQLASAH